MRTLARAALALAVIAAPANLLNAQSVKGPSVQQLYKHHKLSVIRVAVVGYKYNGEIDRSYGTAFIIDSSGTAITSNHILFKDFTNYKKVEVTADFTREAQLKGVPLSVVARNPTLDLAIVKIESSLDQSCCRPVLFGSQDTVEPGDKVYFLGYPGALQYVAGNSGEIQTLYSDTGWWQLASIMNSGNSGGPVFDDRGLCIGVAAGGLSEVVIDGKPVSITGINFVVPIHLAIHSILSGSKVYSQLPDEAAVQEVKAGETVRKALPQFDDRNPTTEALTEDGGRVLKQVARPFGLNVDLGTIASAFPGILTSAQRRNDFARSSSDALQRDIVRDSGAAFSTSAYTRVVQADPGYKITDVYLTNQYAGRVEAEKVTISEDGASATVSFKRNRLKAQIIDRGSIVVDQVLR